MALGGERAATKYFLVAGIVLAALTEAVAGTTVSFGRVDIIGDTFATPDEFAWLDIGYTTLKLIGFTVTPWLTSRVHPRILLIIATLTMGAACTGAAMTARLEFLVTLRAIQGLAGGMLLVCGQVLVFLCYPRSRQPILQAMFAVGSVVAPTTLAPALQGWLLDSESWTWIFFGVLPLALLAAGVTMLDVAPTPAVAMRRRPFDWIGFLLIAVSLLCLSYVLIQGNRWDWFAEPHIVWVTCIGTGSLILFLVRQSLSKDEGLTDFRIFGSADFSFAFVVSFVAGAALLGSAYLIPSFALSVLDFTPTAVGQLLLPSSALFIGALLFAACLMQVRGLSPIATVPFGVLLVMAAMWMLSGTTIQSGTDDMMLAILVRGLGLGFLFLSITLIAFGHLPDQRLAAGIGLFNAGRQIGGLMGVAGLQTLISHRVAAHITDLGTNLTAGSPIVAERLQAITALLAARGIDVHDAALAATELVGREVVGQSTVLAFNTAFTALAALFVIAAPILIAIKIGLSRQARGS